MIAHKTASGKCVSAIMYTKGSQGGKAGGGGKVSAFKPKNSSPITTGVVSVAKRPVQKHPGNSAHLEYSALKFCEFCNYGVQSKHYNVCVCVFFCTLRSMQIWHSTKKKISNVWQINGEMKPVTCCAKVAVLPPKKAVDISLMFCALLPQATVHNDFVYTTRACGFLLLCN